VSLNKLQINKYTHNKCIYLPVVFHPSKEEQPGFKSPCYPPWLHAHERVVGYEVCSW